MINSGNVLGQRVQVTGSSIVNGITSTIPNIGSTTPSAVISLAGPDFGNGFDAARGSLSSLAGTTVGVPGDRTPGGTAHGTDLAITRGVAGSVNRTGRSRAWAWHRALTEPGVRRLPPMVLRPRLQRQVTASATCIPIRLRACLAPLTPEYLLGLLPKNLVEGRNLFFYADPYVEQQLLRQAALRETGQAYFLNGLAFDDQYQVSIDTQQRALLL
ncbi:MAG: hypothetical protein MZW92_75470 [Comamonadaceae bacterium]|nr:hypothetical protein [Comamonadaceae bacterium]